VSQRRDLVLAAAGFLLFGFVVSRIGLHVVLQELAQVRTGIAIIIVLSLVRLVLQTRSWSIALRRAGLHSSTGELMLIRLASQGIGYLTVLGPVASEPMKISLLRKYSKSATAPTLVDTGVYWFTSGLTAIAGFLAAAVLLSHDSKSMASAVILTLLFAGGLVLIARPKSLLAPLGNRLGTRCPRWLRKAERIEIAIREFAAEDREAIRRMFLLDLACQALMALEVVTVFWFLRLPVRAGVILGLEAATRMVKMAAGWLPARIGADESGAAAAFLSFGLPAAAGMALALARRTRDLLASLVGLIWLAWIARRNAGTVSHQAEGLTAPAGGL